MNQRKRAKEAPDYVVDSTNGAMLNTNCQALESYKAKREHSKKMNSSFARLDKLEEDVGEIKSLLKILIERTQ
jgi:hypothetical protein